MRFCIMTFPNTKTKYLWGLTGWLLALLFVFLSTVGATPTVAAQVTNPDGTLDTSFNPGTGIDSAVFTALVQPDGKILVGGSFSRYNTYTAHRIARLKSDGLVDTTFNPFNSLRERRGADGLVFSLALQADGKILVGGSFALFNEAARHNIVRLNSDGSLDTTFNPGEGTNGVVRTIAVQPDGKILLGGQFSSYHGFSHNSLVRVNPDGTLDTNFNAGSGLNGTVYKIVAQNSGKILVGGEFSNYNGAARNGIAQLNPDGTLDSSFDPGSGVSATTGNAYVTALALQTDGKVIIVGKFNSYNGVSRNNLARLNSDGTLDTSFSVGSGLNGIAYAVALQSSGKILVGGEFSNYNGTARNRLARLNSSGTLDTSLASVPQETLSSPVYDLHTPTTAGILCVSAKFVLGLSLTNFSSGSPDDEIRATVYQSDGKLLVGGNFVYNYTLDSPYASYRNSLVRLNPDGTRDSSFFTAGIGANNLVYTIVVQPDGKILVGGTFTFYNNQPRSYIVRLNPDGSLDSSFNSGGSGADANNSVLYSPGVYSIVLLPNGQILVGGYFNSYNGVPMESVARLNSDGTLDSSFNPGGGVNSSILDLAVQSDGKILVGGQFSTFDNQPLKYFVRLNPNGSLDSSFNMGSGVNSAIFELAVQPDGRILIAGAFTSYNNSNAHLIARLFPDGTLDPSFNTPDGLSGQFTDFAVQTDGKIIVVGTYSWYSPTAPFDSGVNRLNLDGSRDFSFETPKFSRPGRVQAVAYQAGKPLVVGGEFVKINDVAQNYLARLVMNPKNSAALSLISAPNPSQINQSVTFTATVTPMTATGTVRFNFGTGSTYSSGFGILANGVATYTTSTLAIGATPVVATYNGEATIEAATSPVYTQTVTKIPTSLTLSRSPNPALVGENITFTATVAPAQSSGQVIFSLGTITVSATLTNGVANYVTNTLATGVYTLTVVYGGDNVYAPSVSAVYTQVVQAPCNPLVVTSSSDDGQAATCGTFSYALLSASSGTTITFALGGTNTISFSGSLTPTVPVGVAIDGGVGGIVLAGNRVDGDGLRLGGVNTLYNLTVQGFGGRELVVLGSAPGTRFYRVRLQN